MTVKIDYRSVYHDVRRAYRKCPWDPFRVYTPPYGSKGFAVRAAKTIQRARTPKANPPSLADRLRSYRYRNYLAEIHRRGGETSINAMSGAISLLIRDYDAATGMMLLGCDGWRYYSHRVGSHHATLGYLCGRDDNGIFAVRVPGTVQSIAGAINRLEPAEVKRARAAGRRVLRQGDVYAIETRVDATTRSRLPDRHVWDAATRTLRHAEGHAPLHVPFPAKFLVQRAYQMGRTGTRGRAD